MAYWVPSVISSAKLRSVPYLMSWLVIGEPSSYLRPSLSVNFHVLPLSLDWPRSVARSGTNWVPALPGAALYAVRVRVNSRVKLVAFET